MRESVVGVSGGLLDEEERLVDLLSTAGIVGVGGKKAFTSGEECL